MALSKRSLALLPLLLVTACAPGRAPQPAASEPSKNGVFDPLARDLDRARDSQKSVDRNSAATRSTIDAAERGDAPP